jgi:hypothetical protein
VVEVLHDASWRRERSARRASRSRRRGSLLVRRFEPLRSHHSSRAKEGRGEARSARSRQAGYPMGVTPLLVRPSPGTRWGYHSAGWLHGHLAHAGPENVRTTPANKGMKLTRPVMIGALQLIPSVRWTRWGGSPPGRATAFLETGPVAASFAESVGGQSNWLCRHGGRVPLWRGGSRPLGVSGPRART